MAECYKNSSNKADLLSFPRTTLSNNITSDAIKIEPNSLVFYSCGWFNFNASDISTAISASIEKNRLSQKSQTSKVS